MSWPAGYGRIVRDETDSTMAEAARRACQRSDGARRCRVIADTPTRFGRLTLVRERIDGRTQLRYRLLMVDGRRHLRVFPRPARTEELAACSLMRAVDSFRGLYGGR